MTWTDLGLKESLWGTSLVVQWLRLHAPNAGGPGSTPGQGTQFFMLQLSVCVPAHMLQLRPSATKKKKRRRITLATMLGMGYVQKQVTTETMQVRGSAVWSKVIEVGKVRRVQILNIFWKYS